MLNKIRSFVNDPSLRNFYYSSVIVMQSLFVFDVNPCRKREVEGMHCRRVSCKNYLSMPGRWVSGNFADLLILVRIENVIWLECCNIICYSPNWVTACSFSTALKKPPSSVRIDPDHRIAEANTTFCTTKSMSGKCWQRILTFLIKIEPIIVLGFCPTVNFRFCVWRGLLRSRLFIGPTWLAVTLTDCGRKTFIVAGRVK